MLAPCCRRVCRFVGWAVYVVAAVLVGNTTGTAAVQLAVQLALYEGLQLLVAPLAFLRLFALVLQGFGLALRLQSGVFLAQGFQLGLHLGKGRWGRDCCLGNGGSFGFDFGFDLGL